MENMKELNIEEMEQISAGYWIIDPPMRKKEHEEGGASGGW